MVKKTIKNIGEILLEKGVISPKQWEQAKTEEENNVEPIHKVLIRLGFVAENDMVDFIAEQMNIPRIELKDLAIDPKIIGLIPDRLARKYNIIPVFKIGNSVTCAMTDVFNVVALDEIVLKTGLTIEPAITTEKEIKKALDKYYGLHGDLGEVMKKIGRAHVLNSSH